MLSLSKTRYCQAVQCPKMLWLSKNAPDAFDDSVANQATLDRGTAVGDLARGLFGDYVKVPFGDPSEMIARTEALLAAGTPIIAEASFSFNGLFCSVDILINHGGRRVSFVEVKSSTKISDIYLHDVSYQYHVLTRLGYAVEKASLAYINSAYVRNGALDLRQLFRVEDLTDKAVEMQPAAADRLRFLEEYMRQDAEPACPIGGQCFAPYPCACFGHCGRQLPTPSIFDIGGIQLRTKLANYAKGIVSFPDIEAKKALKPDRLIQVEHELHDLPPLIDQRAISAFLGQLSYPLLFLDFESFQPAVPLYDRSSPYEQIVFQYSLHSIAKAGAALEHREYLAQPGEDPRRGVAEQLCRDIPMDACILAYNMSFEKGRIRRLAELCPDLADHLLNIHDHIVDLMVPFQKRQYYTRAMQGSYSIKYVLPALYPDDPELDYHRLEGVHNGAEASAAFERMADMTPEERERCRADLLKYCGLDTLAMVRVWEKLRESVCSADVEAAKALAERMHAGQTDKAGHPYITHPQRVAARLETPEAQVVGWLHDTVEDTGLTLAEVEARFGPRTAAAVDAVSRREGEAWDDYLERVKADPIARRVKISDLIDNSNLSRLPRVTLRDVERQAKYNRALRQLLEAEGAR